MFYHSEYLKECVVTKVERKSKTVFFGLGDHSKVTTSKGTKLGVHNISKNDLYFFIHYISLYLKRFWRMKFTQFKFIFLKRKKQGKKSSPNDVQVKYEMN